MKAVFMSDVHLQSRNDRGYSDLMGFLKLINGRKGIEGAGEASERGGRKAQETGEPTVSPSGVPPQGAVVERFFIAGDFFDFWFCGQDQVYPEFAEAVERLAEIQAAGVQVSLCEGNHDFFLTDFFSKSLGMEIFTEWAVLDLDGHKVLLSHGDTIDRRNRKYLLLRKVLRSRLFYRLQRKLPAAFLWRVARISSRVSKELTVASQAALAAKMEDFSREKFQDGFDAVILGHCHTPLLKEYVLGDRKKVFATLGDWSEHRSYLYYEDGGFSLSSYRPSREGK